MSEIDPSKISAIFRTLSYHLSDKADGQKKKTKNSAATPVPSVEFKAPTSREKEKLRRNIEHRLSAIKDEESFERKAPIVTIQEILIWEFGDNIVNHQDFNHLTTSIIQQVSTNEELCMFLQSFIQNILTKK